jgi:NAD(P)-dependent dehydrogenase (short-subunit alcohol dehydrogenase family)
MEGVTVFLTGCGRGVGAALAEGLRDRGASVFAGFHPGETGLSDPPRPGHRLVPVPIDVSDTASVLTAADLVGSRTRSLDLLLNVAGVLGDITTSVPGILDEQDMHRTYDVNAVGPLRVINAFFPLLLAGRTRLVVSISSEAGSISPCTRTGWFAYCMSKAALNMASAIVHNTLRPLGGRVIVMHPGWVRTWMRGTLDAAADLSPREAAEGILSQVDRALADPGLFAGERPAFINPRGEPLPW